MTARDEITSAHDDVARTRAQMASTAAELEARLTGQMNAVKAKLDVVQMIRDNPWTAIAVATGLGVAISATGADERAAVAATAAARQAGSASIEAIKAAPAQAQRAVSAAHGGLLGTLDSLAASAIEGIVDRLKNPPRDGRGTV